MTARTVTALLLPPLPVDPLPARASLAFPPGAFADPAALFVVDGAGRTLRSQARVLGRWRDGSVRRALLVFETRGAQGELRAVLDSAGDGAPREGAIARSVPEGVALDTGAIAFEVLRPPLDVDERDRGILTDVRSAGVPVTGRALDAGLVVEEADGTVYSSQKAGPGLVPARHAELLGGTPPPARAGISIIEDGPVRAIVRVEGRTAADAYRGGLDYIVDVEAYAGRPEVRLSISWLHRDPSDAHGVRSMRFRLPLAFAVEQAVVGTARGPCVLRVRGGRRHILFQGSRERFDAWREDWDGRRFDLANGAASGTAGPGWALLQAADGRRLACHVPGFEVEHPVGIAFTRDHLDLLLWPAEASRALAATRVLAPNPAADGGRHAKLAYECLAHHPYTAFFDGERGCMETVRGMQSTRDLVLGFGSADAEEWSARCASGALEMPVALAAEGSGKRTAAAACLASAADWFVDYPRVFGVSGVFDRGDLYYLVHDSLETEPWRAVLEQHARSGYWNNNEEDPVHGLFRYASWSGSHVHHACAETMARHLWTIDVHHCPPWGVHTHTEGHCFRSQTWSATDHFWLEGLLDYYHATGLPDVFDGVREIARVAVAALGEIDPRRSDLRTVSLAIAQSLRCAEALDDDDLVEKARAIARAQAADVTAYGFLADYGSATGRPRSPSLLFDTLYIEAVAELERVAPDDALRAAALGQVEWLLAHAVDCDGLVTDPAETWRAPGQPAEAGRSEAAPAAEDPVGALQLLACLGHAFTWTGRQRYADTGAAVLRRFQDTFRPPLIGTGHGQVRPLVPATALRCIPVFLEAVGGAAG
jgi:hypothetical protein